MGRINRAAKKAHGMLYTQEILPEKRTAKGEISVNCDDGMIRLRWSYGGERFSYNTGYRFDDERNQYYAYLKAASIKLEILEGRFRREAYKKPKIEKSCPFQIIKAKDTIRANKTTDHQDLTAICTATCMAAEDRQPENEIISYINELLKSTVPVVKPPIIPNGDFTVPFDIWAKSIRHKSPEKDHRYKSIRNKLKEWQKVAVNELPEKLENEELHYRTYNEYLNLFNKCFEWMQDEKYIAVNPFKHVMKKSDPGLPDPVERKALSGEQIMAVLDALKNGTFGKHHKRYYAWVYFIFATGARNAESIGLKCKYINPEKRTVTLAECFARSESGTHHNARQWKKTKTQNIRTLKLSDALYDILVPMCAGKDGEDFVFLSKNNLCIDDAHFLRTVFKKVLQGLGIDYRVLYVARKSLATRAVQQGKNINSISYWLGHATVQTAIDHYIEVQYTPDELPLIIPETAEIADSYNY